MPPALGLLIFALSGPFGLAQGDAPVLTIITTALNVRSGPGLSYPVVDVLRQESQMPVTGRDVARDWWQIQLPDGRQGWVSGDVNFVQLNGATLRVSPVTMPSLVPPARIPSPPVSSGGTVVFQAVSGGPIYALNGDGTDLRLLTTGLDPALSPDGQWVAFTRWDSPGFEALGSVWVININGTGERPVLGGVTGRPKSPTWSPDGQQIAFGMQLAGGHPADLRVCGKSSVSPEAFDIKWTDSGFCYTLPPESFWGLRLVKVATGQFRDLPDGAHAFSPTWDPLRPWHLVYADERGLVSLDINRGTAEPLAEDVLDHSPAFSPDGQRLAVTYLQHDHWDIHVLNADGTGRARLTETSLTTIIEQRLRGDEPRLWNNAAAVWSPDGSQIAFLTDRTGLWEIWVMNADGSNQRPLFPPGTLAGIQLEYHGVDERSIAWGP